MFPNVGFNFAMNKCSIAMSDVEGVSWFVKCLFHYSCRQEESGEYTYL